MRRKFRWKSRWNCSLTDTKDSILWASTKNRVAALNAVAGEIVCQAAQIHVQKV